MRKIIIVYLGVLLVFSFVACTGKKEVLNDNAVSPKEIIKEAEEIKKEAEKLQDTQEWVWPKEATILGVPELKKGKITSTSLQNKTVSIGYLGVSQDDIEDYKKQLENEGFLNGQGYPGSGIWNYVKSEKEGTVDLTVAFDSADGGVSIIITQKAESVVATPKITVKDVKLLDKIPKDVPVFSKGTIINAQDAEILITMEFKDVQQADVDAYKKALLDAGFELSEEEIDNYCSYQKVDKVKMSVIMVNMTYKDGYLTLVIAKA